MTMTILKKSKDCWFGSKLAYQAKPLCPSRLIDDPAVTCYPQYRFSSGHWDVTRTTRTWPVDDDDDSVELVSTRRTEQQWLTALRKSAAADLRTCTATARTEDGRRPSLISTNYPFMAAHFRQSTYSKPRGAPAIKW